MRFEWDPDKAATNLKRHRVSFEEAVEAFFDPTAVDDFDPEHSLEETRFNLIGLSSRRLLFVVYTQLFLHAKRKRSIREFTSGKAKAKNIVVDVTEKEYRTDLARGLREDEVLKPGRHMFKRGGFLSRHGLKPGQLLAPVKVRISINLDLDVLNYFKQRAAKPNAAPYQTQINDTLRAVMEREKKAASSLLPPQAEALLADQRSIEAVAKRVAARGSSARKRGRPAA